MQTKQTRLLVATIVTALNLNTNLRAEPSAHSGATPMNRAVLAAPRTLEEFPALTRVAVPSREVGEGTVRVGNRAFAASPRVLEEFPELTRVAVPRVAQSGLAAAPQNRAFRLAPRTIEEFPALAHAASLPGKNVAKAGTPNLADAN